MRNELDADRLPWKSEGMEVLDAKRDFVANTEDAGVARLVAAAPELLGALKTAYELLRNVRNDGYAGVHLPTLDWALDGDETGDSTLVRALDKAEGR